MGKLYDLALPPPVEVYWLGNVEEAIREEMEGRLSPRNEKAYEKVLRLAKKSDLTLQTQTRQSCLKPRPIDPTVRRFRRDIAI